jgi:hypothetical protein
MKTKTNWIKKNKNLLIILGVVGLIIILPLMIFFILYYINYNTPLTYGNQSILPLSKDRLMINCNDLCNSLDKTNQTQIKNYCCYSKDTDYDNFIENNGNEGPEFCALAYNCNFNCTNYGFDSVEGCGLNG